MKSFELQATRENILNTFLEDTIERDADVQRFIAILNSIEDSCSIALDGQWGSGKTFFVKQVKMILDAFNDFVVPTNSEDVAQIKIRYQQLLQSNTLELQPQVSIYYDAWANDNDEDPILSLVYEILRSVKTDFKFSKGIDCLRIAGSIAEFFTGKKVNEIFEALKKDDPLSALKSEKDIHKLVEDFLDSVLAEKGNRLVIFIDELDRCKPSYAVQLLERIKHYFSNDRITFVFSINTSELQHTIKRYYGNDFDSGRYLDRFFDLRISLPPANMRSYYGRMGLDGTWVYENVCRAVIEANHFTLREISKFYRLAKVAAYKPTHKNSYSVFGEEKSLDFCLLCIVPIMIGIKMRDQSRYNSFVQGKDGSPLYNVLKDNNIAISMCNSLLSRNETYGPKRAPQEVSVLLKDKLKLVYEVSHTRFAGALRVV